MLKLLRQSTTAGADPRRLQRADSATLFEDYKPYIEELVQDMLEKELGSHDFQEQVVSIIASHGVPIDAIKGGAIGLALA